MLRRLMFGLVVLAPSSAAAQLFGPQWPDNGFLSTSPTAISDATSVCVTELEPRDWDAVVDLRCTVVALDTLQRSSGGMVLAARYERWVRHSLVTWEDSVRVDEVVVFEVDHTTARATPVWHRVGFDYFLGAVEWGQRGPVYLLQVFNCARGTGGCVEDVLVREGGSWRIAELTFIGELEVQLPPGYQLSKGRRIDLSTLKFEQPISSADDPNCCPSASLIGALRLEGVRLRLDSVRVTRRRP